MVLIKVLIVFHSLSRLIEGGLLSAKDHMILSVLTEYKVLVALEAVELILAHSLRISTRLVDTLVPLIQILLYLVEETHLVKTRMFFKF